jgi:hypothetical protein
MPSVRRKSTMRINIKTGEDDQWIDDDDNEMSDGSGKSVHSLPKTTTSASEGQSTGSQQQLEDEGALVFKSYQPSSMVLAKNGYVASLQAAEVPHLIFVD